MPEAFFLPDGDRVVATGLTRGPWDDAAQHFGPPAALIGRALERCAPREDLRIARVTFEILKPVPIAALSVAARVARPGRSVELLDAELSADDGPVARASAWRIAVARDSAPSVALDDPPPPGPQDAAEEPFFHRVDEGYGMAMEWRFAEGAFREPGPAKTWLRMRFPLIEGEQPTPLQRVLIAADSGNGVSAALDPRRYVFINTDLIVQLVREPVTEWVMLDAVTRAHPDGIGLTETVLWDERGRIGRAAQTLLVRAR